MGSPPERSLKFSACWVISTFVIFGLMVTWSFATPLGAAPDEPAHIIKAAAVARGEFLGQPTGAQSATRAGDKGRAVMKVLVPATYAESTSLALCYRHHPKVTAECAPAPATSDRLMVATTYVGRYPPLYYLVVGWPTRYLHSGAGIYLMRVLSSLASALLLGLALATSAMRSRSRFLPAGVALAATPMVVFLSSTINPSGLEIAASIAVWTTGLILVMDHSSEPPTWLVVAVGASSCVLESIRGLSPIWLALIVVALVALEPRSCWQLVKRRAVQLAAALVVVVGLLASTYTVLAGALTVTPTGFPLSAHATVLTVANIYWSHLSFYITQTVGDFGWLDTPAPFLVVFVIGVAMAGLLWLAVATSRRRHAAVLIAVVVGSIVVPIVIDIKNALQIHNDVWQSRYALPLYVGVPLMSAAIACRSRVLPSSHIRRLVIAAAVVVAASQFVCFFAALRRYMVGVKGGLDPFAHVAKSWTPPISAVALLALAALFTAFYGWWIVRLDYLRSPGRPEMGPDIVSVPSLSAEVEPAGAVLQGGLGSV